MNTYCKILTLVVLAATSSLASAQSKPNILVIWGDDIGWFNVSAYNRGMMGYKTPNIDRIANEGILFTDAYGQNSCTAGRAAFITGQSPFRTGLLKVGLPKLFNLRRDPFERAEHESIGYEQWRIDRIYLLTPAVAIVGEFLATFREYPQRQRVGSFNLDQVMESLQQPASN